MFLRVILSSTFVCGLAMANGGVVGNGGDSVMCQVSTENQLEGIYSLDYILGLWRLKTDPDYLAEELFTDKGSFAKNFARLIPLLSETYPELADSLRGFQARLFAEDLGQNIVWKPALDGLIELKDEQLLQLLPKNCLGPNQVPSILQTIIRQQRGSQTVYNYDDKVIKALSQRPMQLSFLLFHEWLWSFTQDVSVIRDANLILHARDWSKQTVDQQVQMLKNLQLFNVLFPRMVKTKLIFAEDKLRITYDGEEVNPAGQMFNIQMNPLATVAVYEFVTSEDYYLSFYSDYNDSAEYYNGRPQFSFAPGEQRKVWIDAKDKAFKVVLKKRLSSEPVRVFTLNFQGPK